MKTLTSFSILAVGALMAANASGTQDHANNGRSLQAAVEKFNMKATGDPVGKTQPPLTEDEVISAIRGWNPKLYPDATDKVLEDYRHIAETRELPENAKLRFTTRWTGYNGFRFQVWWIDLIIETGEKTDYGFRIRDQKISSNKMTPAELAELERRTEFLSGLKSEN